MKPNSDPGLHLTPGRRRWLIAALVIGLLLAIGWALTERAGAAPANTQPARVCTAWKFTCTARWHGVCYAWRTTCSKYASRIDGLASMRPAPLPCTCTAGGKSWPCVVQFRRVGVKWIPAHACIPPKAGKIAGLAAPLPGNMGGCKESNYWTGISCMVAKAVNGNVSGKCELGYTFSGKGKNLQVGDAVSVSGCLDDKHALFDGGRKYPLVIKKAR